MFQLHMYGWNVPLVSGLALSFVLLRVLKTVFRSTRRIDYLPGPPSMSWSAGNYPELVRPKEIGDADLEWNRLYGTTIKIKDTFGRDMLFTSDPQAFHHMLNRSGYSYRKSDEAYLSTALVLGKGIVWAEGDQHARQRKIMNPAFSLSALRELLPVFRRIAFRAADKMEEQCFVGTKSQTIDVLPWLSRTTLDIIGEAALGHEFHAFEPALQTPLVNLYQSLFKDTYSERSNASVAFHAFLASLPSWIPAVALRLPFGRFKKFNAYQRVAHQIAKDIVQKQTQLYFAQKEGTKDVMSILVRANLSEDPKSKLGMDDILPQLTTLFLAGHDSVSMTTSWVLYQLSKNPQYQSLIREEIKATRSSASLRGDHELSMNDLDSMKLLLAVVKETLRFNPIVPELTRVATTDDVIPLSIPQQTKTGKVISSIPISKGQRIMMSFFGYNRLPQVWGDDADQWRPERFLDGTKLKQEFTLGVIGNVISFNSGLRSCIGWKFAILEMQTILIELLERFEFSPSTQDGEIIRGPMGAMTPMVDGPNGKRKGLPLLVATLQ